jgi:hypothetical protein
MRLLIWVFMLVVVSGGVIAVDVLRFSGKMQDTDGDGVYDPFDDCENTSTYLEVDSNGCSILQFCYQFNASTSQGRIDCSYADWKDNEVGYPRDCYVANSLDAEGYFQCKYYGGGWYDCYSSNREYFCIDYSGAD